MALGEVQAMIPDFLPEDDDDETIPPHFNDTGDFGDHSDDEDDEE